MSAVTGIDLGSILNGIGTWFSSFFNTLVQYAPVILTVTVAGFLIYRYAGVIRRSISQLLSLF
jgi:predicted membrane-bound mannosyltransferase